MFFLSFSPFYYLFVLLCSFSVLHAYLQSFTNLPAELSPPERTSNLQNSVEVNDDDFAKFTFVESTSAIMGMDEDEDEEGMIGGEFADR